MVAYKWSVIFTILFILFSNISFAHGTEEKSIDETMNTMMSKQNISNVNQIDCSKVSDVEFEELGDAVMERMAGNHELHEQMDLMMGGEGSESLKQMHIVMGKNWLGCGVVQGMMGSGGMMGINYGMMPMMMRMMGNYYPGYYANYNSMFTFAVVGWIFVGLLIVTMIYFYSTNRAKLRKRKK